MSSPRPQAFPEDPVLVRYWRGGEIESVHRGAWCVVDVDGAVLAGAGAVQQPFFVRSSIKSLQAMALLESGAAERFGLEDEELALTLASHAGEERHTRVVQRLLERHGLGPADLRCGVHAPFDEPTRRALRARGESPSTLHNNCSGKHAGFLLLARHLEQPLERYLEPEGPAQALVRALLAELTGVPTAALVPAIDGCSAPTYRLPLVALATAFARLTTSEHLAGERGRHAQRLTRVAGAHPTLIAGSGAWLDSALLAASGGRLFPKYGAEAVQAVGWLGAGRALALKIDDGGLRALQAFVPALLAQLGWLAQGELAALARWRETRLLNFAGREVGHIEVLLP